MRKLNATVVIGLLMALVGAGLVVMYGASVERRIASGRETVTVLVASGALDAGSAASGLSRRVETKQLPRAYAEPGALQSLDDVADLVLTVPVTAGRQLSRSDFGRPESAGAVRPTKGRLAVAVQVGLSPGVARYVTSGSLVDVFVTYANLPETNPAAKRTKLFASAVKVLSVSIAAPEAGKDEGDSSEPPPQDQVIAVLEVAPAMAERLVNAATLGEVYLGLSAGDDHSGTSGVLPQDVAGSGT